MLRAPRVYRSDIMQLDSHTQPVPYHRSCHTFRVGDTASLGTLKNLKGIFTPAERGTQLSISR